MDRSCFSKLRHFTLKAAEAHADRLSRGQGEDNIEPYPCKFCGGWHVGHSY